MINVNKELRNYIENSVMIQYDENNIRGHGKEHIETVISRSFELAKEFNLDLDPNMIYVIAAFHDIGYKTNPDEHEEVSSKMFLEDIKLKKFFNDDQIKIIADAIVDHRASLEYEPRSIYGKLVSSADREISVENMLKRSILFQSDKHKNENPTSMQVIEYSYKKLSSKYGKGGYAKMYFQDEKYLNYLQKLQELLGDKDKFINAELDIINEIEHCNEKTKKLVK